MYFLGLLLGISDLGQCDHVVNVQLMLAIIINHHHYLRESQDPVTGCSIFVLGGIFIISYLEPGACTPCHFFLKGHPTH
jgi:hypothetical protein